MSSNKRKEVVLLTDSESDSDEEARSKVLALRQVSSKKHKVSVLTDSESDSDEEARSTVLALPNQLSPFLADLESNLGPCSTKLGDVKEAYARDLASTYEHMDNDSINKEVFMKELNHLHDLSKLEGNMSKKVGEWINLGRRLARPIGNGHNDHNVTSKDAFHVMKAVEEVFCDQKETGLTWHNNTVKKTIFEVRRWSVQHEFKKPKGDSKDQEEHKLAKALERVKRQVKNDEGYSTDLQSAKVVMRGLSWFEEYVSKTTGEYDPDVVAEMIRQVVENGASKESLNEPDFDGKTPMPRAGNEMVYRMYTKLLNGSGHESNLKKLVDALIEAGHQERADWHRGRYYSNRTSAKQSRQAVRQGNAHARNQATGGEATTSVD